MLKTKHKLAIITALTLGTFFLVSSKASAATINVAAGTDGLDDTGTCQLSEAIINVNDQAATHDDCAAGTGSDTINIASGTILLTDDIPEITRSVTITGAGKTSTTIDGDDAFQGFNGGDGNADHLSFSISSLTLDYMGGTAGVIYARNADLVVNSVRISNTTAIEPGDGLPPGCVYHNNEGASNDNATITNYEVTSSSCTPYLALGTSEVADTYALDMQNVYVHDNELYSSSLAFFYGYLDGTASIKNVTVENNSATNFDGENIFLAQPAIFVSSDDTDIRLSNATFADNTAFFGGVVSIFQSSDFDEDGNSTSLNVTNSTFVNNTAVLSEMQGLPIGSVISSQNIGSGVMAAEDLTLTNNLFSGNAAAEELQSCVGLMTSAGGNIIDDNSCDAVFTEDTDQTSVEALPASLGSLTDNGGPVSTIALAEGSPAIDAGVSIMGLTTDARGVARPQCDAYDSGAYEYDGDECPGGDNGGGDEDSPDADGDGISDSTEDGAPNKDGNSDGIDDSEQANVSSFVSSVSNSYITLVTPEGSTITSVSAAAATHADSGKSYPFGLVSFTVTGVDSGSAVPLSIFYVTDQAPSSFSGRKFFPSSNTYQDLPSFAVTQASSSAPKSVKLAYTITDGSSFDLDGSANGTIVDPVGLAASSNLANTGENSILITVIALGAAIAGAGAILKIRSEQ